MEQIKLLQQTKRNEERAKQEMAEILAYEKQYGKVRLTTRHTKHTTCYPLCLAHHFLLFLFRLLFGIEKLT